MTLEQRAQAADGGVGITTTFAAVAHVWAKIEATKGSIYAAGVQVVEAPTHRIVIRHRAMTDFDHVSLGEQRWRARDVRDPDGTRKWIEIMAEELRPGADT
ncbi:MAG: phage head closure protein [Burkholderiales bacterium]|nr:phage head closure protein [Burkholderiales bacterium]